jgi:hypothetical protein
MEKETLQAVTSFNRYWVTDHEGKKHLFLDHLAAQLAEVEYRRLEKEAKKE